LRAQIELRVSTRLEERQAGAGCSLASGCPSPRLAAMPWPSATCVVTSHGLDAHLPGKATITITLTALRP